MKDKKPLGPQTVGQEPPALRPSHMNLCVISKTSCLEVLDRKHQRFRTVLLLLCNGLRGV